MDLPIVREQIKVFISNPKSAQYKNNKELCDKIVELLKLYGAAIGLQPRWRIDLQFKKVSDDDIASCEALWHYTKAYMVFDIAEIKKRGYDDQEVEEIVRHELLHIPCWRLNELVQAFAPDHSELLQKYEEDLVSFLEMMPIWSLYAPTINLPE